MSKLVLTKGKYETLFGVDGLIFSGPVSDFISFTICITVYMNQMRKIPKVDELLV